MELSKIFKTLLISLGFVTTINISFTPPEIYSVNENLYIQSSLKGAVTKEVKELILSSTKVFIEYKITLFTNEKKWVYTQKKSIKINGLTREFEIENNDKEVLITKDLEKALKEFINIKSPLKTRGRIVVIKGRLIIPEIKDQNIVDSLWQGIEPRITYSFTGE